MNSNVKTKVLARALLITLLVLQSNADFEMMSYTNCGPSDFHLYNLKMETKEDRWSIVSDVIRGSNASIVHTVNITKPFCHNNVSCENSKPMLEVQDIPCNSPNLDQNANKTCQMIQAIAKESKLFDDICKYYNIRNTDFCIRYLDTSLEFDTYMDVSRVDKSNTSSEFSEDISNIV